MSRFKPLVLFSFLTMFILVYMPHALAQKENPVPADITVYYVRATSRINVRAEASTTSGVVTSLAPGAAVNVLREVRGTTVSSSRVWYEVVMNDDEVAYIHSSLLSRTRPIVRPTSAPAAQAGGSGSAAPVQSAEQPAIQPTAAPVTQPEVPFSPAPSYSCNCSKTCGQMTCEEAYFQLNTCGCRSRDADNDGVPCESICPGG